MALTIQERQRPACGRGLTLEQLAEQTHLLSLRWAAMKRTTSRTSATMPISSWRSFCGVTADYLLGLTGAKNHPNADLADLRLSDR